MASFKDGDFLINPLTVNYADSRRTLPILPGLRQVVLYVQFIRGTADLDLLLEFSNRDMGDDQFYAWTIQGSAGDVSYNELHFNLNGNYRIPVALVDKESALRVSAKSANGNGSVKIFVSEG